MQGLDLVMDFINISQALALLPHNPVQPSFAIIRLPVGTNVPALYALLCQFGLADVKFSTRAESWQDAVESDILMANTEVVREDTPPAPTTTTVSSSNILRPSNFQDALINPVIEAENETTPTTPIIVSTTPMEADEIPSTSVDSIVQSMISLHKTKTPLLRGSANGYTRCQKCQRLLSTTSGSLISHAISHCPVKRFGCPLCNAQFFKKSMFNDHIKSTHPDDVTLASAIDLRTERASEASGAIRMEWRRVAIECFPSHSHLFKAKLRSTSTD